MHNHENLIQTLNKIKQKHIETISIGLKKIIQHHTAIIYTKITLIYETNKLISSWINLYKQAESPSPKIQRSPNLIKIIYMHFF